MIIDASTYPTFAAAVAAADAVKFTTGSTLYVPGSQTTYDATGLTLPHNTQLVGDGSLSQITGRMTIGSAAGQQEVRSVWFKDGIDVASSKGALFNLVNFSDTVQFKGSSYYNTFNTCRWLGMGAAKAITTESSQNFNRLIGCRFNHEGDSVHIGQGANGWAFIGTAFEGEGANDLELGVALNLESERNLVQNCWFERGASRTYPNFTIKLGPNSKRNVIDANSFGYLVTIQDLGSDNDIRGRFAERRAS